MSLGSSLGAFAQSFAGARQGRKDREERAAANARQDRMLDIMEKNPGLLGGMIGGGSVAGAMGAVPSADGGQPKLSYGNAVASLPSGERAGMIRAGLIKRGMPEHAADGFLMNFHDESGLNPGINEAKPLVPGSRGGYGLYQATGPRRVSLERMAQERGVGADDIDLQLDHLMYELGGPESRAAKSIYATTTPGAAASAIATSFLRPAKEHLDRRVAKYNAYDNRTAALGARPPAY